MRNLNGIICCHRKFFIDAGLYNENIDNYGREDCEMFEKLEQLEVVRKILTLNPTMCQRTTIPIVIRLEVEIEKILM